MPIEFKNTTLSNGLKIIAEVDPHAHTAAAGFFVKTGARDETSALMGVSHFLEHMMFKGTETRTAEDVDRQFDELGVNHNAFTTSELTAFWAHGLPEHLERSGEILADIMRPSIRVDDFNDEKSVILEEIAMYADQPFWVLYEQAMETFYGDHPLGHRVLGTNETVTNLTRDQMTDYFTNRYSADNTVVALSGRLDFDHMVQKIDQWCGDWNTTNASRSGFDVVCKRDELNITSAKVNRHYLLLISPAPALGADDRYAATMLTQILGDYEGSRLYWALIETGLADEAQAQYEGRDGAGEFLVYCSCSPENAKQVETIVRQQVDQLLESLTDDDLQRVRSKIATAAALQGELPAGRMRGLGRMWTYLGEYRSLEEELKRLDEVTLDDLRRVGKAFPMQPHVTARLSPQQ